MNNWILPEIADLPLSQVNNSVLKRLVSKMVEGGLSPKTIDTYLQPVKMVVASLTNKEGEPIYPRKWNHAFADVPMIEKAKQNRPIFSVGVMTGLAAWKKERERILFILCGAAGVRIGEALGLELDKHFSDGFSRISIEQKVRHCVVEGRLKTPNARRVIDLHPDISALLAEFAGERKTGVLFRTRNGKALSSSTVLSRHLHPALKALGYLNPFTGTHKAGSHAFRRFRNTHLRNRAACPPGCFNFGWVMRQRA